MTGQWNTQIHKQAWTLFCLFVFFFINKLLYLTSMSLYQNKSNVPETENYVISMPTTSTVYLVVYYVHVQDPIWWACQWVYRSTRVYSPILFSPTTLYSQVKLSLWRIELLYIINMLYNSGSDVYSVHITISSLSRHCLQSMIFKSEKYYCIFFILFWLKGLYFLTANYFISGSGQMLAVREPIAFPDY